MPQAHAAQDEGLRPAAPCSRLDRPVVRWSFTTALAIEPVASIAFEPKLFGTAANNGQMIAKVAAKARAVEAFGTIAEAIAARDAGKRRDKGSAVARLKGLLKGTRG